MSTSALRMVLGDLKELFIAEKLTFPQYQAAYQAGLAAAHDRSLAAESSLSPKRDQGAVAGGSSLSPKRAHLKRYQGESQSAFTPPLPLPKAQGRSKVVDKSGDKSVVKS